MPTLCSLDVALRTEDPDPLVPPATVCVAARLPATAAVDCAESCIGAVASDMKQNY